MSKKKVVSGSVALVLILAAAAAILLFKLGRQSAYNEKWSDYDDYGWA